MRAVLRCIVVLAAVATTLVVTAVPAAAWVTLPPSDITAGTLTLTKAGQPNLDIPLASTAGCGADDIDLDYDAATSAANITAYTARARFAYGGADYIAMHTRMSSTPGTITGSGPATLAGLGLKLKIQLYTPVTGTTCTSSTLLCTLTVTFTLAGTYSGSPSSPSPIDEISLTTPTATGTTFLGGACAAPFSTHILAVPTVTGLLAGGATKSADVTNGWEDLDPGAGTLALTSGGSCGADELRMKFVSPSSAEVIGFVAGSTFFWLPTMTTYVVLTTVTTHSPGTFVGSSSPTLVGLTATFETRFYIGTSGTCVPTGSPVCTYTSTFVMNGSYTGNPSSPTTGVITLADTIPGTATRSPFCSLPSGTGYTTSRLNSLTAS